MNDIEVSKAYEHSDAPAMEPHEKMWLSCANHLRSSLSETAWRTWFQPIQSVSLEKDILTIAVPSAFFYEWIESNYLTELKSAIQENIGAKAKLKYTIRKHSPQTAQVNKTSANNPSFNVGLSLGTNLKFNSRYTFESFVEGLSNKTAANAAKAIASRPSKTAFNPLVIYGGVGLGKTHLLQAIGADIQQRHKTKKIAHLTADQFTIQFIHAIKQKHIDQLYHQYEQADILLIDDIQFFKGKPKMQEILFHLFNSLHQEQKQIVFTSDTAPRLLQGMEQRLLSRFKWGLTAELKPPELYQRRAIIRKKIQEHNMTDACPEDAIEYLAHNINTNIREVEGVVVSLCAHANFEKEPVTVKLAQQAMQMTVKENRRELNLSFIQHLVSEYFQIPHNVLKEQTRRREILVPRQVAMYLAKKYTNASPKHIGFFFGGKDHSTVIHAIRCVDKNKEASIQMQNDLASLQEKIELR